MRHAALSRNALPRVPQRRRDRPDDGPLDADPGEAGAAVRVLGAGRRALGPCRPVRGHADPDASPSAIPSRPRRLAATQGGPPPGDCSTGCARGPATVRSPATGSCATGTTYRQVRQPPRARPDPGRGRYCSGSPPSTRAATSVPPSASVRVRSSHRPPGRPGRPVVGGVTDSDGRPQLGARASQGSSPDRRVPDLPRRTAGAAGATPGPPRSPISRRRPPTGSRSRPSTRWGSPGRRQRPRRHDRDAAADRGAGPRIPARDHRRELPRPAAPLPPDRHDLSDLLRLPRAATRAMLGAEDPLVTRWAQMRQILVMPRFDCQRADDAAQDPDRSRHPVRATIDIAL